MSLSAWKECVLVASRSGRLARASRLLLGMMVLLVVELAHCGDVSPTSTSTTTTTTTSERLDSTCSGVTRCLHDTHCAQCLSAINSTAGFPHTPVEFFGMSLAEQREYNVRFFTTLQSTASCSTDATPSWILHSALRELGASLCTDAYRMAIGSCLYAEYVTMHHVPLELFAKMKIIFTTCCLNHSPCFTVTSACVN